MELSRRKLLSSLSPSLLSLSLPPACRARQFGLLSSAARRYRPTSSLRPGHSATARATTPALKPSTVGTQQPPSCVLDQQLVRPATDFAPKLPTSVPTGTILVSPCLTRGQRENLGFPLEDKSKYKTTTANAQAHNRIGSHGI